MRRTTCDDGVIAEKTIAPQIATEPQRNANRRHGMELDSVCFVVCADACRQGAACGELRMRIIACTIVAATVVGCAAALSPREAPEANEAQVRMDVEAILKGMAAAHGMGLEASVPEQRPLPAK
jgi:hypothetical protein